VSAGVVERTAGKTTKGKALVVQLQANFPVWEQDSDSRFKVRLAVLHQYVVVMDGATPGTRVADDWADWGEYLV
jgi:hypothetical protein